MMLERLAEIGKIAEKLDRDNPAYDALNDALDHIAQLEAQRGGAVVVPDYPSVMVRQSVTEVARHAGVLEGVKWARENAKAIPADRVPDGMVGVDREAITRLSTAIDDVVITSAHHAIGSIEDKAVSVLCMAFSSIAKALRSAQETTGKTNNETSKA